MLSVFTPKLHATYWGVVTSISAVLMFATLVTVAFGYGYVATLLGYWWLSLIPRCLNFRINVVSLMFTNKFASFSSILCNKATLASFYSIQSQLHCRYALMGISFSLRVLLCFFSFHNTNTCIHTDIDSYYPSQPWRTEKPRDGPLLGHPANCY